MSEQSTDVQERYWLRVGTLPWQEATKAQFIAAEGAAGFYPKSGCGDVATGGFTGSGGASGRVTYGEITERNYGWDPDFLKIAGTGAASE